MNNHVLEISPFIFLTSYIQINVIIQVNGDVLDIGPFISCTFRLMTFFNE